MRQREAWAVPWARRFYNWRLERSRAAREREARKRAREGDLVRRAVVAILTALAQGRALAVVAGEGAEGTGLRASAGASGPPERGSARRSNGYPQAFSSPTRRVVPGNP